MKIIITNKHASFHYNFIEKYTAGIILFGHEVKGIKEGCGITNAYIKIVNRQALLCNCKIDKYKHASNIRHYDELRERELLLKTPELKKLIGKMTKNRLFLIPTQVFISDRGFVKVEIALCTSQTKHDQREKIKQRDIDRSEQRSIV